MSIFSSALVFDVVNPLMPGWFDFLSAAVLAAVFAIAFVIAMLVNLAGLALVVAALVSIFRRRDTIAGTELAVWVAVIVLGYGLGAIAWFVIGRRTTQEESREAAEPVRD